MVLNCFNSCFVVSNMSASGSLFFAFWPKSSSFSNPGRAKAAARHAGYHGLISFLIWRHSGGAWAVSSFLMVSVVLSARGTLSPWAADGLRSRRIRKLVRPWWPACRAAAFAGLGFLNGRLFGRNANKSINKPKEAPRRRLVCKSPLRRRERARCFAVTSPTRRIS